MGRHMSSTLVAALVIAAGTLGSVPSAVAQVSTGVTYQGQLKNAGVGVNSPSDFRFTLWDAASGGNQVGATDTKLGIPVSQGLFSSTFDCGVNPYTAADPRWLQIEVRNPSNTGEFVPLVGRQRLTAAPFSLATRGLRIDSTGNVKISGEDNLVRQAILQLDAGADDVSQYAAIDLFDNGVGKWGIGKDPADDFYMDAVGFRALTIEQATGNVSVDAGRLLVGSGPSSALFTARGRFFGGAFQVHDFPEGKGPIMGTQLVSEFTGNNAGAQVRFTNSEPGTGFVDIGLNASNDFTVCANDAERLVVTQGGNVGIGVVVPAEKLSVGGNIRVPDVAVIGARQDNGVTGSLSIQAPGTLVSDGAGSRGGTLRLAAGNCNASCGPMPPVGESLDNNVHIVAGDNTFGAACGSVFNGNIQFFAGHDQPERMRIVGDNGQVLIGTTTAANNGFKLDVAGNIRCVGLTQTSAREFKQDIVPLSDALDSIMKLRGVSYAWNGLAPEHVRGNHDIGFLADEVNQVLPDIVAKDEAGKPIGIDYGKIAPVAVEAIKQLKAENDELKARLERLEALVAAQSHAGTK